MIIEKVDKHSGAILFKRDKESITLESLVKEVDSLRKKVNKLERTVKKLEETQKKDSSD